MKHLAVIADGNRRWAKSNSLPIEMGYIQGLTTIEKCCMWAIENNIQYLTAFCFSTENWGRSEDEVNQIMDLGRWYFKDKQDWYVAAGIRVCFSGRRDRVADDLIDIINTMENVTAHCKNMTLVICADYGGRDEIARAVMSGARTEEEISSVLSYNAPDPDVILRTGGQRRLSNFLLWQAAYAELFFLDIPFPALEHDDLDKIIFEYNKRKRNYGK